MPLRVVFWFGREFKFSSEPTIAVYVPTLSALGYSIPPNLNKLGAAFVEGHISVEEAVQNYSGPQKVWLAKSPPISVQLGAKSGRPIIPHMAVVHHKIFALTRR